MRQIGRELEGEQGVIQLQMVTDVLTHWGFRRELQQALVFLRKMKFAGRTQHALAFHAAQFTQFDEKRLTIFAGW